MVTLGPIQNVEIFNSGADHTRDVLQSVTGKNREQLHNIQTISFSDDESEANKPLADDATEIVLNRQQHRSLVDALFGQKKGAGETSPVLKIDEDYALERTNDFPAFSEYEQNVHNLIVNGTDILRRIFNRRSGIFSWILLLTLKCLGFKGLRTFEYDFEKVEKETVKDPEFSKKFAIYYSRYRQAGKAEADKLLPQLFKVEEAKEGEDPIQAQERINASERKQSAAKLYLKTINISNKIPEWFINWFSVVFSVQNIFMPWLSWLFPKGIFGGIFHTFRIINPSIDEMVSTVVALNGDKMQNIQKFCQKLGNKKPEQFAPRGQTKEQDDNRIGTITLSNLNAEGYGLKQIRDGMSAGIKRLWGFQRNATSWIVTFILKGLKFEDYSDFEQKIVKKPKILEALYEHLADIRKRKKEDVSIAKVFNIDDKIKNPFQRNVAKGILALLVIANRVRETFLKKVPQYFGLPYSILYPVLPLISTLVGEKGFFGKLIGWVQRISPLINDLCVDLIASAFEETTAVKRLMEMENTKSLFENLPKGRGVLLGSLSTLMDALKRLKGSGATPNLGTEGAT